MRPGDLEGIEGPYETGVMESLRFTAEKTPSGVAKLEHRRAATPLARALAILQFASEKNVKQASSTLLLRKRSAIGFHQRAWWQWSTKLLFRSQCPGARWRTSDAEVWRLDQVISEQETDDAPRFRD